MGAIPLKDILPDSAINALLQEWYPIILRIAQRIQDGLPNANHHDDLIQRGARVVWENHAHYLRESAPEDFCKWLTVRIRGAMLDLLREEDWMPRRLRQKTKEIERAAAACRKRLLRHPSDAEIAAEAGLTMDELHRHYQDANRAAPALLDDYQEYTTSFDDETPETGAERTELRERLVQAIEHLPERERTALSLYILEDLSLEEICTVMGFKSKNTAAKLVNTAVFQCRVFLAAQGITSSAEI